MNGIVASKTSMDVGVDGKVGDRNGSSARLCRTLEISDSCPGDVANDGVDWLAVLFATVACTLVVVVDRPGEVGDGEDIPTGIVMVAIIVGVIAATEYRVPNGPDDCAVVAVVCVVAVACNVADAVVVVVGVGSVTLLTASLVSLMQSFITL